MSLKKTLGFITSHPLNKGKTMSAVARFGAWQIQSRISSKPKVLPFAEKSKFMVSKGLTGATGNYYCGLHEFEDMSFVLHFLRETDFFADIGANVGSFTLLAACERGADTLSVEPVPSTFKILKKNIDLNQLHNWVSLYNVALGSEKGSVEFTQNNDTTNHVASQHDENTAIVTVETFDRLVELEKPTLIKINVEGYEQEVLIGMENALKNDFLKAIIIQLNGNGTRYGHSDEETHLQLVSYGFEPFDYNPHERALTPKESYGIHNTLYIRDLSFVEERIKEAKPYHIHGHTI